MRTLLVAVDFSTTSRRALEAAVALAQDLGARLVIVHAYSRPPRVPAPVEAPIADPVDAARLQIQFDEAVELSTEWAEKARQADIDVLPVAREGSPVEVILEEATKHGASLVVVGQHGWQGLKRFVLGSVSEAVVRKSTLPVLVVPPPRE